MTVKNATCAISIRPSLVALATPEQEFGDAITRALWSRITTDATLLSVFDNPFDLYLVMAPQDPDMPYGVHRLEESDVFLGTHTYLLDLWDYAEEPTRIVAAVKRLRVLLHELTVTTYAREVLDGRMEWFSGGFIPTDGEKVWHFATQWSIRCGSRVDRKDIVG